MQTDFQTVFIIPDQKKRFIIYLPIQGIIFEGNAGLVNLFFKALKGDNNAQERIGLTSDIVEKICHTDVKVPFRRIPEFQPTSVSLFLTTNCSLKCKYCYANGGESVSMIKKQYIEAAVSEIIRNALIQNKKSISINYHGGGDISQAWDLVEKTTGYILQSAKDKNLNVRINAGINGVLSDYQREWIVKYINSVTVSIDGPEEIQNKLRPLKNGKPSFDYVHATLKYFDDNHFRYAIRSTITADTVKSMEDITYFFCKNYDVRKIKMEPVSVQGRATDNRLKAPSAKDFVKHFIGAQKIAASYNRELLYSGARFETISNIFCKAAGSSFGVTPDGYITSCYEVLDRTNPLSEIFFYGKIYKDRLVLDREKLKKLTGFNVFKKEKCRKCFARFHCAGDCPAKSILFDSEDQDQNYRCFINRELTKYQLLNSIR
jgi:uncharacterized protein